MNMKKIFMKMKEVMLYQLIAKPTYEAQNILKSTIPKKNQAKDSKYLNSLEHVLESIDLVLKWNHQI